MNDLKYKFPGDDDEEDDGAGVDDLECRSVSSSLGGDLGGELLASSKISAPSGTSICRACIPELNLIV